MKTPALAIPYNIYVVNIRPVYRDIGFKVFVGTELTIANVEAK